MPTEWGVCPICKRDRQLEEEHILGQWLAKRMLKSGMTEALREVTMMICQRCNRNMARNIEDPVIDIVWPMIRDHEPRVLNRDEQKRLMRWAVKVMVLVALTRFQADPPEEFIDWLAVKGRPDPPPNTTAWIGHFVEGAPQMSNAETEAVLPGRHASMEWGMSFVVGGLVVLCVYPPTGRTGPTTHVAESLGYLVRLDYPFERGPVAWPPLKAVDEISERRLRHAFVNIPRPT